MVATGAEDFLIEFHRANPGVTSREFARGRCEDGRSSYQLLADLPDRAHRVLDLACGDGYLLELLRARGLGADQLVGVDMSPDELEAARGRPTLAGVQLLCERAQALSVADRSIDYVVSHLAFMLMTDLDQVAAELARVLRPGGKFSTVVGGGPGEGDAFELFLELFHQMYQGNAAKAPRVGDKRARHEDLLREICNPDTGWQSVTGASHVVRLDGSLEQVWATVSSIYELHVVAESEVEALRARFESEASARWDQQSVPCVMRHRLIEATTLASR